MVSFLLHIRKGKSIYLFIYLFFFFFFVFFFFLFFFLFLFIYLFIYFFLGLISVLFCYILEWKCPFKGSVESPLTF